MKLATEIGSFILIPMWVMLLATSVTTATSNYDYYLLSCGRSSSDASTNSFDGRTWISDENSSFSTNLPSTIAASVIASNFPQIPFSTARIFTTNFTYSFPVSPGPKFIRLFFYPSAYRFPYAYRSLYATDPYLTVESSSGHRLLRNFSAYLSLSPSSSSSNYVQKEFYVAVSGSRLQLSFFPSPGSSYAFVNGIEVVSVPENLYIGGPPPEDVAAEGVPINLTESVGLETAYRLNVGGNEVGPKEDNGDMYRTWVNDEQYLFGFKGMSGFTDNQTAIKYKTNYSAPATVYRTYRVMGNLTNDQKRQVNVTWEFDVDFGFAYLVRLHWCEVVVDINAIGFRVFSVLIDNLTAEETLDIYYLAPGSDTAMFKDYYVVLGNGGYQNSSRAVLQLTMHPYFKSDQPTMYYDILLNGLEIFKISRPTDHSLDAPNPSGTPHTPIDPSPLPRTNSTFHVLPAIIGAVIGAILLTALLCYIFIFRRRKWSKTSAASSGTGSSKSKGLLFSFGKSTGTTRRSSGCGSSLPSHLCQHFSLAEIRLATSDFSQSLIVGHGGFGNVYKGTVNTETGPTPVAIKRLNPLSGQGTREFTTEIGLLSKLRHVHLVSLIGYCDDAGEMILVYEFMSRGTLRDHLYPHPNHHLPWTQRLQICVGAARGLHYLHTGTQRMIIHRDVKSTNILVDDKWVAKVSDFGLSKLGPVGGEHTHVSTAVKGSFGYVDPEYYRRQQLTEKSDVYSFGVVLFEVLCGRAAVNPALPKEQVNLRIWARKNQASGTLDTIVDPNLKGQIALECLRKFGEVAGSCVRDEGANRPSMVDVIWGLEFALQLQMEAVGKSINVDTVDEDVFSTNNIASPTTDTTARLIISSDENTWTSVNNSSSGLFSSTTSNRHGGSNDVFSQIFKPEGR